MEIKWNQGPNDAYGGCGSLGHPHPPVSPSPRGFWRNWSYGWDVGNTCSSICKLFTSKVSSGSVPSDHLHLFAICVSPLGSLMCQLHAADAHHYLPADLSSFPWAWPKDSLILRLWLEAVAPQRLPAGWKAAGSNSFQAKWVPVGSWGIVQEFAFPTTCLTSRHIPAYSE